jgi:hypothetical protein
MAESLLQLARKLLFCGIPGDLIHSESLSLNRLRCATAFRNG